MAGRVEKKGCGQRLLREQIARTCLIRGKEKGRSGVTFRFLVAQLGE